MARSLEWSGTVSRVTSVLPILFAAVPGAGVLPVWFGILVGGYAAGSLEAGPRHSRRTAVAERQDSVAKPLVWKGAAILRITGWPSTSGDDRWRSPARILYLGNEDPGTGLLKVFPGQGVMIGGKGEPPLPAALVTGQLELVPPASAPLPGAFDFRLFLAGRGLSWRGKFSQWKTI
jgi:hypothetical protein